jgi:hypothetical protein
MKQAHTQPNRTNINLIVDSAIFIAFLVAMAPRFSGMMIHEWLGFAFGAAIVTHLLLHWQWLVEVTKRFFGKAQWSARINYILNALLFVDITTIIFSGLMISESALPVLGITLPRSGNWRMLHTLSADLFLVLVGLHIALHWQWIAGMVKRLLSASRRAPRLSVGVHRAWQEV